MPAKSGAFPRTDSSFVGAKLKFTYWFSITPLLIVKFRSFTAVIAAAALLTACKAPTMAQPEKPAMAGGASTAAFPQVQTYNNKLPAYPAMAKRLGQQGKTIVRVLIDMEGRPSNARVLQSSGYTELDQAALDAVSGWQYAPGRRNGALEPMELNIPITWTLN